MLIWPYTWSPCLFIRLDIIRGIIPSPFIVKAVLTNVLNELNLILYTSYKLAKVVSRAKLLQSSVTKINHWNWFTSYAMLAVFLQKVRIVTDLTALWADPATACLACAEKKACYINVVNDITTLYHCHCQRKMDTHSKQRELQSLTRLK